MSGGKLIVVPTPVGNLGDMTPRALEVLKEVSVVLAEDTRTTGKLLRHFGVETPLKAFHPVSYTHLTLPTTPYV